MAVIVFDLDGTISNPSEGITKSLNYSLAKLGYPVKDKFTLESQIGPPLDHVFQVLMDSSDPKEIDQAVFYYRQRYDEIGFKENIIYPEIIGLLEFLQSGGHFLYVATYKPQHVASQVINHFNLQRFFKGVFGAGIQRAKKDLLVEIIDAEAENSSVYMVGDRSQDMIAGHAVSAVCLGVLWGFGNTEELNQSNANQVFTEVRELKKYFSKL